MTDCCRTLSLRSVCRCLSPSVHCGQELSCKFKPWPFSAQTGLCGSTCPWLWKRLGHSSACWMGLLDLKGLKANVYLRCPCGSLVLSAVPLTRSSTECNTVSQCAFTQDTSCYWHHPSRPRAPSCERQLSNGCTGVFAQKGVKCGNEQLSLLLHRSCWLQMLAEIWFMVFRLARDSEGTGHNYSSPAAHTL